MKEFGFESKDIRIVNNVRDLWKMPPFMVVGRVKCNSSMHIDGITIPLKDNTDLVLPFSLYEKISRDVNNKQILKPSKKKFKDLYRPYRGQDLNGKSLLLMRTGGIGDIMFSQPICRYLKYKYPDCYISYAVSPRYATLFTTWPVGSLDNIISIPFALDHMNRFDYHLSFEGVIERTIESTKIPAFNCFAKHANLNIDFKDKNFSPLLIPNDELLQHIKLALPNKFIVVQIRSTSPLRNISQSKTIEIIRRLSSLTDAKFAFLDAYEFQAAYDRLIDESPDDVKGRLVNLSKYAHTLLHTTCMLSLSEGVVGVDSSFSHIAGALDKPILGLYGSFKGDLRLPYYDKAKWVQSQNCGCGNMPCFIHSNVGRCSSLTDGYPECMESLDVDDISNAFKSLFN